MFNMMTFTYLGQMLMSLLRDSETAQGLGGLVVGLTVLFCGILLRPDDIPNFWVFGYWMFPGHYVFEGIFMSQYDGDDTPITATAGSPFYMSLPCEPDVPCVGTAEQWIAANFTDWDVDNIPWNALYFIGAILLTRGITLYALTNFDFRSN
jgi:ABC-type multidrug transport system permease subunit